MDAVMVPAIFVHLEVQVLAPQVAVLEHKPVPQVVVAGEPATRIMLAVV
jgi:hypothetical protein